jgi:lysophospholipase L1-like esterase
MEAPIADLLSQTEAAFFVIDCLPNMSLEQVKTNTIPLVETIRAKQASTPIVFVENTLYATSFFDEGLNKEIMNKNAALKAEYKKLLSRKVKNIFYIETKNALGNDHDATVDGVHFTDLGFSRFAEYLLDKFYALKLVRR